VVSATVTTAPTRAQIAHAERRLRALHRELAAPWAHGKPGVIRTADELEAEMAQHYAVLDAAKRAAS
jgi:hypothetical protein